MFESFIVKKADLNLQETLNIVNTIEGNASALDLKIPLKQLTFNGIQGSFNIGGEKNVNATFTKTAFMQVCRYLEIPSPASAAYLMSRNPELFGEVMNQELNKSRLNAPNLIRFVKKENRLITRAVLSNTYARLNPADIIKIVFNELTNENVEYKTSFVEINEERLHLEIIILDDRYKHEIVNKAVFENPDEFSDNNNAMARPKLIIISNEVGTGRFKMELSAEVLVCKNGMTMHQVFRKHSGERKKVSKIQPIDKFGMDVIAALKTLLQYPEEFWSKFEGIRSDLNSISTLEFNKEALLTFFGSQVKMDENHIEEMLRYVPTRHALPTMLEVNNAITYFSKKTGIDSANIAENMYPEMMIIKPSTVESFYKKYLKKENE